MKKKKSEFFIQKKKIPALWLVLKLFVVSYWYKLTLSVKFDGESYDAIEKGSLIKPILTLSDIERQPWQVY